MFNRIAGAIIVVILVALIAMGVLLADVVQVQT